MPLPRGSVLNNQVKGFLFLLRQPGLGLEGPVVVRDVGTSASDGYPDIPTEGPPSHTGLHCPVPALGQQSQAPALLPVALHPSPLGPVLFKKSLCSECTAGRYI